MKSSPPMWPMKSAGPPRADLIDEHARQALEHPVALVVAVGVVVGLELVEVDVEHGERPLLGERAVDARLDGEVARQAREGVGVEALARALEDHADAGQELAHVDGLGDEVVGAEVQALDLAFAAAGGAIG